MTTTPPAPTRRGWLGEAQARAHAATSGPWERGAYLWTDWSPGGDGKAVRARAGEEGGLAHWPIPHTTADADFIAAARTDLPRALALLTRIQAVAEERPASAVSQAILTLLTGAGEDA